MSGLVAEIAKQAATVDPGFRAMLRRNPQPTVIPIAKSDDERRYVLGVAHPAGWRDAIAKSIDGGRDYMTAPEVEKAAWWASQNGGQIGLAHEGFVREGTSDYEASIGKAEIVESYIWRGDDWTVTDTTGVVQVIKSGDWLVGGILDVPTWERYKRGEFTGWSIMGMGIRRTRQSS